MYCILKRLCMERIEHLNISRSFAILAVVYIHISCIYIADNQNSIAQFISNFSRFAVPLFILISGFLHASTKKKKAIDNNFNTFAFLIKKVYRLLVPYFLFSFSYMSIRIVLEHLPYTSAIIPLKYNDITTIFYAIFLDQRNPAGHLYYLPLLFFIIITFSILEKFLKEKRTLILTICILLSTVAYVMTGDIYLSLNPFKGLGFYAAGYFLFYFNMSRLKFLKLFTMFSFAVYLSTLFALVKFHSSNVLVFISEFAGMLFVFSFSISVSKMSLIPIIKRWFTILGETSFTIYLIHEPYILTLAYMVCTKILKVHFLLAAILAGLAGLTIPIIIEFTLFKKFPIIKNIFLGFPKKTLLYTMKYYLPLMHVRV